MTMRVIWEIHNANRPLTFREIQEAADTNPGVLNTRIRELREALLIERATAGGYRLTSQGASLVTVFLPIAAWADQWGAKLRGRKS